jgi:general secretion pathway protein E
VCPDCAIDQRPPDALLEASGLLQLRTDGVFRTGKGCAACRGSGYRGRRAIGELLVLDDEFREAIIARAPVRQLKELAAQAGVRLIRDAALDLMGRGLTTLDEVNRVTAVA